MTEPNPQPPTNIDAMSPPHELRKGGKQGAIGSEQEWTAVSTGAARHRRRARITSALFAVLLGVLAAPATRSAAEDPPFLTGPSDAHRVAVSSGVNKLMTPNNAVIMITHYQRLLNYITPDLVHVMRGGQIIKTGNKELALELETRGYDWVHA